MADPHSRRRTDPRGERAGELDTVESQRNDLTAEEFPEGPYGMSLPVESLGKSSPWREGQESPSAFSYENVTLHRDLPRQYPADDPQDSVMDEDVPE